MTDGRLRPCGCDRRANKFHVADRRASEYGLTPEARQHLPCRAVVWDLGGSERAAEERLANRDRTRAVRIAAMQKDVIDEVALVALDPDCDLTGEAACRTGNLIRAPRLTPHRARGTPAHALGRRRSDDRDEGTNDPSGAREARDRGAPGTRRVIGHTARVRRPAEL